MKPYSDYSAEELAMENLFIRWVRFPDDPSIRAFWENWIIKYPYMKSNVEKARELVLAASDWKTEPLTNQDVNSLWGRIRSSIELITEREPVRPATGFLKRNGVSGKLLIGLITVAFLIFLLVGILK